MKKLSAVFLCLALFSVLLVEAKKHWTKRDFLENRL